MHFDIPLAFPKKKRNLIMALITVYGRVAEAPVAKTGQTSGKAYASVKFAENQKKNATTGERPAASWSKLNAFTAASIAALTSVTPKDFVKVTGYPKVNAFSRKDGTPGAEIEITVSTIEIQPDKRVAAGANSAPAANADNAPDEMPVEF
jgi:single-stranded DNA-binding protein